VTDPVPDRRRRRMLEILLAAAQQYGKAEIRKVRFASIEEEARCRLIALQSKLLFAGLHVMDDGRLFQVKPPLPGFEDVAEAARRAGAVQHCYNCHREQTRCRCQSESATEG
jgi:hypothetical protein